MKLSSYLSLRLPNFSVHALRGLLEDAGLDWQFALARADIELEVVNRPGGTIPARKELAFQLEFAAATKDRADLWLQAARAYIPSALGTRGLALATAPTVAAFVESVTASDSAPGLMEIAPLREADGTPTGIEFTYPEAPAELIPFSVHRDLFNTVRTLSWLYGSSFPFTHIELPLPTVSSELAACVPCPIDSARDALRVWWDVEVSAHDLPFGDAFQHETWIKADTQILDTLRSAGDWPAAVDKVIRAAPQLNKKLDNAAAKLGVSPRSLRRKLQQTGDDFGRIRDATLNDLASHMLSNTSKSVAQISGMLGYAEPTSFSMAFKRWTGMPPSAFREASRYSTANRSRSKPE